MSARTGMFVTVTRPPGSRRMPLPRSPDLFCLSVATSKVLSSERAGDCADTTAAIATRHTPKISVRMMFSIYTFDAPFGRQAASPASGLARRYDGSFGCRGPHLPFRRVCRAITTEIRDRDDRAPIRLIRNVNDGG